LLLAGCQKGDSPGKKLAKHIKKGDFISFEFESSPYRGFVVSDAVPWAERREKPEDIRFGFWVDFSEHSEEGPLDERIIFGSPVVSAMQTVYVYTPSPKFKKICHGVRKKTFTEKIQELIIKKDTEGNWQGRITNGIAVITGYSGPGGNIKIPKDWNGVPVRQIGTGFWEPIRFNEPAVEVVIPHGVRQIGDYAFAGHYHMQRILFPETLVKVGQRAFEDCYSLSAVFIPDGVEEIGSGAFSWCFQLNEIKVDDENPAYSSSNGVLFDKKQTELIQYPPGKNGGFTIPSSVISIGAGACGFNSHLTNVVIPSGVKTVGSFAFELCDYLKSVSIPESVENIGEAAFGGCLHLEEILVEENNPRFSSKGGVLYNKDGTVLIQYAYGREEKSFAVPEGVQEIGRYAFWNCTNLVSVKLPEGLVKIGKSAFMCAKNLQEVEIPASVKIIERDAFAVDSNLSAETLKRISENQSIDR